MLYIFRRSLDPKNKEQSILNILNNINFVIIFTNFIEYSTISSFLIEACRINKISNFIFTEYNTGFIFNEVYFEDKFKTCIKNISKREPTLIIKPEMYIENYIQTNPSINGTIEKLREKYSNININKRDKRIKFLFDKDEQRLEKKHRKTAKEIAYHNYELKRNAWIKDIIPRH